MSDIETRLAGNRAALDDLIASASACADRWDQPSAPGKWSPAQLTEHVARSFEEGANVIAGRPNKFPNLPFFLRPLVRRFLFDRVVRTGRFPKAKTNKAMDPESGPHDPDAARQRLLKACDAFEAEVRAQHARGSTIRSGAFGQVALLDYVQFNETHTRHHRQQLPTADA